LALLLPVYLLHDDGDEILHSNKAYAPYIGDNAAMQKIRSFFIHGHFIGSCLAGE
jgi:hypothetical protein